MSTSLTQPLLSEEDSSPNSTSLPIPPPSSPSSSPPPSPFSYSPFSSSSSSSSSRPRHSRSLPRKFLFASVLLISVGVFVAALGFGLPPREHPHGTRLLSATHIINATHVTKVPYKEAHLVVHNEAKMMHLRLSPNDTEHKEILKAKFGSGRRTNLLRTNHEITDDGAESKGLWDTMRGLGGKIFGEKETDISLPTVLAYARMASSAYDWTKGTYDGSTGDTAHGKGDGYGHARSDDQSHVKAVVYESGVYNCWIWCSFSSDYRNKRTSNVVVAFKGTTEIGWTMRSDFLTDADMFIFSTTTNTTLRDAIAHGPHIMQYWTESQAVVAAVRSLYPETPTEHFQLSFTGHSLGGVLAGLHATLNNVIGIGFNSPPSSVVAEIVGVKGGEATKSSFCTYNTAKDGFSNQSPPDVLPILLANMGGLDLLFLHAQVEKVIGFYGEHEYAPQIQIGRVATLTTPSTVVDPVQQHSIVTVVAVLEAMKKQEGSVDLRCE